MPKKVSQSILKSIFELKDKCSQGEIAERLNVSRMYVNAIINKRPIKRTRKCYKGKCPITGF